MAGQLIQVATNTVTSAVESVTLTGIVSDDVYIIDINNVTGTTDPNAINIRFTVSGTADTSANYDLAQKVLKANAAFSNQSNTNQTAINGLDSTGTSTSETVNAIYYLFNFNNASEYSFVTIESTGFDNAPILAGFQGGGVLTVAQACDGYNIFYSTGNIASGTFTLYRCL